MNSCATAYFLVCAVIALNDAVPLHTKLSRNARDTFILMPGVNLRRNSVERPGATNESPMPPPLIFFGDSFDRRLPADPGSQRVVQRSDTLELLPVTEENYHFQDEGSGGSSSIGFPGQNQEDSSPSPVPSANAGDDGSGDIVFFPTPIKLDLSNRDANDANRGKEECSAESGFLNFNGTCTRMLARNGCPKGEWFALNSKKNVGECVIQPCPAGQLMYMGKCVNVLDNTVCGEGQMLYVDFTGYVHCDCLPNFFYDPWSGKCFAQGDQGYCNFGQYLVINQKGVVECSKNPCLVDGYVYHNESGRCYRKLYRGFCDEGLLLTYPNNGTAECQAILIRGVFDLPTLRSCTAGSLRDFAGNCRQEFRIPSSSSYPTIYGGCPPSHTKDPLGNCRKTHSLFG